MSQLRKHYASNRKRMSDFRAHKFANMRAAKERIRLERAMRDEPMPDNSHVCIPRIKPSGFRVTIECLDDGQRASFTSSRLPWGLSVSPTAAGKRVAVLLREYQPNKNTILA